MTPFEDEGGGGGGGQSTLVMDFNEVYLDHYTDVSGLGGVYVVRFRHSGSIPAPHTIAFTLKATHCTIDGTSGVHSFSVTGSPDVPSTNFFEVFIDVPVLAAGPTITMGIFPGGEETPDVHSSDNTVIPAVYGTPQQVLLTAY